MLAPQLRETAPSSSARRTSLTTGGLKLESISPDRQRPHHFLADLKAALPNTQASPTFLKLFFTGGRHFLAQDADAWWWSPCGCWLESHYRERRHSVCGPCGPIHATQIFGAVTCVATKGTSLHLCNHMGAELFVDGRLNSCPSNPFMIPAWCVKIAEEDVT